MTVCESIAAFDGSGYRPAATRTCRRSAFWTACHVRSAFQRLK